MLGFQFSQFGPQFYVEIGIIPFEEYKLYNGDLVPKDKLKYYHCHYLNRKRIGDNPFDLEKEQTKIIADKIINCISEAELWWNEKRKETQR